MASTVVLNTGPHQLEVPECRPGIGSIILSPDSPDLIAGVRIEPYAVWPDDRGYFLELIRMGHGLAAHYPAGSTQVAAALSYAGTIKAFHYHQNQEDLWCPTLGMFQVALVDLRRDSPTWGVKNTMYVGALRPWQILIPAGVGHGYKVIGADAGMLLYVTSRFYDRADEGRIPWNDPSIRYDWEIQHK